MKDIRRMPWGELILMLQAKADTYKVDEEPEEASFDQIASFFGA